jgi:hypothetical protein
MTLEQLLDCSADELEAMTDAELLQHFEPFFKVTRPELAPRPVRQNADPLISPEEANQLKLKVAKLKALGIEVDEKAMLAQLRKKKK